MLPRAYKGCPICGMLIDPAHNLIRGQKVHTSCLDDVPYDLTISVGNFYIELHTQLVSRTQLRNLLANVKRLAKETNTKINIGGIQK